MPFKPIKSKYEIDEVDEEVLWEKLRQDIEPTMTIKVGGIDIDVFFVPGDNDSFGDFTYLQTQIRVDSRLEGGALVDTLLHEVFHAIWSIGQLKEKDQEEERAVAVMASYMTQILRDNPHLVKWITKNLPRNG